MCVAKDAIPKGNTCMALRHRPGAIFNDALFAPLFPGQRTTRLSATAAAGKKSRRETFIEILITSCKAYDLFS
jgi:hypothetical protein